MTTTLVPPSTMARSLTERLRGDIILGNLPPGSRLRLPALGDRYGSSLIPLREALSRLASHGLVTSEEQKGFSVAPVSREDLLDLTETRIDVECLALRKAIARGDVDWEARIMADHHKLRRLPVRDASDARSLSEAWEQAHTRFHEALVAGCGSPTLLGFRHVLADRSTRYRRLSIAHAKGEREIEKEHDRLAEAVLDRNADLACARLAEHFWETTRIVLAGLGWPDATVL